MKSVYWVGAHKVHLFLERFLETNNALGYSNWDSKAIWVRTTSAKNGKPHKIESALVVFFHEMFHMLDFMQGHRLFYDSDNENMNEQKEDALDSLCEALVVFLLRNNLLDKGWLEKFETTLINVAPLTESELKKEEEKVNESNGNSE